MTKLTHKLRTEPVMVPAVVVAVAVAACSYFADGGALAFTGLLPVVAGAIGRSLVMPANGLTLTHPDTMGSGGVIPSEALAVYDDGGPETHVAPPTIGDGGDQWAAPGSVDIVEGPKDT